MTKWLGSTREWLASPTGSDLTGLPPLAAWDQRLYRILPYVFAVSTGFQVLKYVLNPHWVAYDALLYTAAAREWLAGGSPWTVSSLGIPFGAPPPTLLAYAPFTVLPDPVVAASWVVGSFVLAGLAMRALRRPMWWIAFWPIVDSALVGNPDVAILALLVIAGHRFDFVAPVLKVYAVLPLIAERRWRSLAAFGAVLLVTAPVLPWADWLAKAPSISSSLELHAVTTSVWGEPVLMAIGVVALASLGLRRAGWLVVPLLWPWTQTHYMAISVPALTPLLAIAWSMPNQPPVLTLGSIVAVAVGARVLPARRPLSNERRYDSSPRMADRSDLEIMMRDPQEAS